MTASNHALAAMNLVAVVQKWWIMPVAFISHFVLDTLPHYGESLSGTNKNTKFFVIYAFDLLILCLLIVGVLFAAPANKLMYVSAALIAVSPDVVWFYRLWQQKSSAGQVVKKMNFLTNFHKKIQKYEFKQGLYLEVFYFFTLLAFLIYQQR